MTHPTDVLSAYLDGELPETERRAIDGHLSACASCARHLAELAAIEALARDAGAPEAPPGYFDALPSRVRARIRAPRRAVSPLWLLPLAAGIMVAVLAPPVLRDNEERAPAAPAVAADRAREPARDAPVPAAIPPAEREEAPPGHGGTGADAAPTAPAPAAREKDERPAAVAKAVRPGRQEAEQHKLAERRAQAPFAPPPPAAAPAAPPAAAADAMAETPAARAATGSAFGTGEPKRAGAANEVAEGVDGDVPGGVMGGVVGGRADVAQSRAKESQDRAARAADDGFRAAAAIPLTSAEGARRALAAWRAYAAAHPDSDEARVRIVEAAVAVHRATGDAADRAAAQREGEAYLRRADAADAARVRAALRALDR
jgi:hypothetical protein